MIFNNLFPVFALVLLGRLLRRYHLTSGAFLATSDRLIYYIFFPVLLFWKVGSAAPAAAADLSFCVAAICALATIFISSSIGIKVFRVTDFQAGSFSQSCYRFNSYIGMAIVFTALGDKGIRDFGILIGFLIPIINVLSVSILIWFSGKTFSFPDRCRITLRAIVSNPLIIACVAGILYARYIRTFPVFIDNTFRLAALVTLPMALLSIGGALTLSSLKGHLRVSLVAAVYKLALYPLAGYLFFRLFHITGTPFQAGMIFFALPTSTTIYILSSQLNSDTDLASASVVLSTILSFVSLTVALSI
jgi:predicted permease